MDEGTALLIVGGVLSFMGVAMNINPIKFDEDLLGALEGELSDRENMLRNFGAQLRTVIGALAITLGIIAIYNRDLPTSDAEDLLLSMGMGFVLLMGVVVAGHYRGFVDRLIIPPLVIFTVLSSICFYAGLM
ncbi:MAG: hypothetical protein BET99_04475 [Marine Group III euryarchaeote CG-Epi2]|uniref:Uncharacterized protein n=1 Tax=Marine Group III euryarchaeote CG-Epi2 TaxID=1888996 RepID=A0A1J5U1J5_9ARCH|nr:MAG: hypothetical protein BET99_04475 [Marine Group III euryarchaeote CG-Epi2]